MATKTKILLIEDNEDIREVMKDMLTLRGYDILEAKDGPLGIQAAISKRPNIIICDIMMPIMDGFEVLLSLRQLEQFSNTPFIFVTAKADSTVHREAMNLGADDFITKPFSANDLVTSVETRMEKHLQVTQNSTTPSQSYLFPSRLNMNKVRVSSELLIKYGNEMNEDETLALYHEIYDSSFRISKQLENYWIYNLLLRRDSDEGLEFYFEGAKCSPVSNAIRAALNNRIFDAERDIDLDFPKKPLQAEISKSALEKVAVELIDNAFAYRDEKSKVYLQLIEKNNLCILRIRNKNSDLTHDDLPDFKPFEKFHSSNPENGAGLGLYISRKILSHFSAELNWHIDSDGWVEVEVSIPSSS